LSHPHLHSFPTRRSSDLSDGSFAHVAGLSWKAGQSIIHNAAGSLVPLDDLPDLPYERVDMARYLHENYLGRRTVAHNSSYGCPLDRKSTRLNSSHQIISY